MGRYWISLLHSCCRYFNSQRYISEVLEPVVLPYLQGLATAIFQQDYARPHVARILKRFFVNHEIELLPWPARSPDLSPIENMWSLVAQRLTQITPPAASPDQLWQRVEAVWSAVPQEHIQSFFESIPRLVAEAYASEKQRDFENLLDFIQSATRELKWMSDKEEAEVARDWSAKNLNLVELEHHQEV
ncbi:transposable element Tcb1 transposase [Trichonephila clavipes]|nr:transposable element Tcb1 transposase [Trichonephila clavipes]